MGAAGAAAGLSPNLGADDEVAPSELRPLRYMKRPKFLFLDVNETLLDLAPLKESVAAALDGREEVLPMWFTTLLQYSLVVTVADRYENFGKIGAAALQMVAAGEGIKLTEAEASKALEPINSLSPHPDVEPALRQLNDAGFKLVTLTNSSVEGVRAQMENSELQRFLTDRLSVEEIGLYKPHQHVYRWAARKVGEPIDQCLLIAAHGWDIAGALWSGMRGAFVARPGAQIFPSAPEPEIQASDLGGIAKQLLEMSAND